MGTSPHLQLPTGAQVPSHFLSSSFSLLLSFVLPGYVGIFLVLLGVQGPLLVFSRCSVRIVPFVDVFLTHLRGEMNSTSSYSSTIVSLLKALKWTFTQLRKKSKVIALAHMSWLLLPFLTYLMPTEGMLQSVWPLGSGRSHAFHFCRAFTEAFSLPPTLGVPGTLSAPQRCSDMLPLVSLSQVVPIVIYLA